MLITNKIRHRTGYHHKEFPKNPQGTPQNTTAREHTATCIHKGQLVRWTNESCKIMKELGTLNHSLFILSFFRVGWRKPSWHIKQLARIRVYIMPKSLQIASPPTWESKLKVNLLRMTNNTVTHILRERKGKKTTTTKNIHTKPSGSQTSVTK